MLKRLFTSNTRIKLLTVFLMNLDGEFFIRELTRKLDEQINSVRRELDNLKKMGLLKAKTKNGKKYYHVNKDFLILEDLKNVFIKALTSHQNVAKDIEAMGSVKLLALSGIFVDKPTETVDMLIVGEVDRNKLAEYINNDLRTKRAIKLTIMNEDDYNYRLNCKDKFIYEIINNPENQILINKLAK